jgi:hypothetical protein
MSGMRWLGNDHNDTVVLGKEEDFIWKAGPANHTSIFHIDCALGASVAPFRGPSFSREIP